MKQLQNLARRSGGRIVATTALLCFLGSAGQTLAQARYSYTSDGDEVTDNQTGLIWRRCSEGQSWYRYTRKCVGAALYNHEQALAHARSQSPWRLPNAKELTSLVDYSRKFPLAIDPLAFPGTPSAYFWSSTPYPRYDGTAVRISFVDGHVGYDTRNILYSIRLVR